MHNSREITRVTNKKLKRGIERDRLRQQVKEEQRRIKENRRTREKDQDREKAHTRCEMAQLERKRQLPQTLIRSIHRRQRHQTQQIQIFWETDLTNGSSTTGIANPGTNTTGAKPEPAKAPN